MDSGPSKDLMTVIVRQTRLFGNTRCYKVVVWILQFGEYYSAQSEDEVVGGSNLYHTACVPQLIQQFSDDILPCRSLSRESKRLWLY